MMEDSTETLITDVKIGDLVDFYPILEFTEDPNLQATRMVAEMEYFTVEEIVRTHNSTIIFTDTVNWEFPNTDTILVAN